MSHHVRCLNPGGCVLVVIHRKQDFMVLHDLMIETNEVDIESIFIELIINKSKHLIIGCIYRPPDANIINFNK